MRAVIQRVKKAEVSVHGETVGAIGSSGNGLLIFLGVGKTDEEDDLTWLVDRVMKLRIFEDADGKMNKSVGDLDGEAMVISQFTLFGSVKKGNRPSFNRAAPPELAVPLYERFAEALGERLGKSVPTGRFAEPMRIQADNDGPVTLILDSQAREF